LLTRLFDFFACAFLPLSFSPNRSATTKTGQKNSMPASAARTMPLTTVVPMGCRAALPDPVAKPGVSPQ
jgi:hypothetical protein